MGQMVTPSHGLNGMVSARDVYVFVSGRWRAPRARTGSHRAGGGAVGAACRWSLRVPPTQPRANRGTTTRDGGVRPACGACTPGLPAGGPGSVSRSLAGGREPLGDRACLRVGESHCVGGRGEWGRATHGCAFGRAHVPDAARRLCARKEKRVKRSEFLGSSQCRS